MVFRYSCTRYADPATAIFGASQETHLTQHSLAVVGFRRYGAMGDGLIRGQGTGKSHARQDPRDTHFSKADAQP